MSDAEVEVSNGAKLEEFIDVVPERIRSLQSLGPYLANQDNAKNFVYFSDIPDICKDEPCVLGVDEAGRGPVLGPMVYGISFCPVSKKDVLKKLGCADSKQLTEDKRESIFVDINVEEYAHSTVGWAVEVISPNVICNSMLRRTKYSLNQVSMDSAIGLIKSTIEHGVNVSEVYVDTVGPAEKYQAKLKLIFPELDITVAKKADSTYPIVSAASICAKVTRDHALKVWKFPEGLEVTQKEFGSGYPGDPLTKSFIADQIDPVFGYPRLVRFSWSTAEKALEETSYRCDWDSSDEEDDETENKRGRKKAVPKNVPLINSFYGSSGKIKQKRHIFFKERFLNSVHKL